MTLSSVVRLGPNLDNVSAKLLKNAIVSFFDKKIAPSSDVGEKEEDSTTIDNDSGKKILISNKYFTANILLEDISGSVLENSKEDGIILVFDALHSNPDRLNQGGAGTAATTFDSLAVAHRQAEDNDTCGDILRLCVGVSLTSLSPEEIRGKDHEKEYSRRILWCLDHGYEYVEADLSQAGQLQGHDDRDKEGFARIIEAISGAVWSTAVMAKSKARELKESYAEASGSSAMPSKENNNNEKKEEESNPYEPPDPAKMNWKQTNTTTTTKLTDEELAAHLLTTDNDVGGSSSTATTTMNAAVGSEEMEQLRQDLEAEKFFDQMEGVLKEASKVRQDAKNGILTDDERRARAGDAALALVNLMNQFGMDDDDSVGADSDDSGIVA